MTKSKKILYGVLLAVYAVCMAVAAVYDLAISRAVADPQDVLCRILEILGEPPSLLFCAFNAALVIVHYRRGRVPHATLYAALAAVGMVGVLAYTSFRTLKYILAWTGAEAVLWHYVLTGAVMVVLTVATMWCASRVRDTGRYVHAAVTVIFAALTVLLVVDGLKLLWGRVRYRDMVAAGDLSAFTPWYVINFFGGDTSFPSGHTANATVILTSVYYFKFLPEAKRKTVSTVFAVLLALWVVVVALSRVFVGAHFLSDVLTGGVLTVAIVLFWGMHRKEI